MGGAGTPGLMPEEPLKNVGFLPGYRAPGFFAETDPTMGKLRDVEEHPSAVAAVI